MATVAELRAALNALDAKFDDATIKAWLPGSTISLGREAFFHERHQAVLVEGNVDPGSALEEVA